MCSSDLEPIKSTVSISFLDKRDYPASLLLDIANALLLGEIKLAEGDYAGAAADFRSAVAFQDRLPYAEPPLWYYPRNDWSLFGLSQALEVQGKSEEAAEVKATFATLWQMSDIKLTGSKL